jgi:hypothetical protein
LKITPRPLRAFAPSREPKRAPSLHAQAEFMDSREAIKGIKADAFAAALGFPARRALMSIQYQLVEKSAIF